MTSKILELVEELEENHRKALAIRDEEIAELKVSENDLEETLMLVHAFLEGERDNVRFLNAAIDRRDAVIAKTPHPVWCMSTAVVAADRQCTCWKAEYAEAAHDLS